MTECGVDAVDAICDLLLAEDLRVNQVTPGPWSETLPAFVAHPAGMVGTDSTFVGLKPSPRTYGSYPRILGQFVRDEQRLSLEEAVRKMTSAPAARLGIRDRGLLRDGLAADLVVFDPARIRSNATYDNPARFPTASSSWQSTASSWWTADSRPVRFPDSPAPRARLALTMRL